MAPPKTIRLRDHIDGEALEAMPQRARELIDQAEAVMLVTSKGNVVSMRLEPNPAWREIEKLACFTPPGWADGQP